MVHSYAGDMRMLQKFSVLFHSKQFVFSPTEKSLRTKPTCLSTLSKSVFLAHNDSQGLSRIVLSTF